MAKDETVKSAVRMLLVLEAMNQRSISSVEQLHQQTGLTKPTLVRLLNTLIGEGYVQRLDGRGGYRLMSRVLELSRGFEYRDEIVVAAIPHLQAFTRKHKWPVTILVFDTDAMVPKYTTMKQSPLSYEPDMKRSRLPVTASAMGLAWLAFRPEDERELVINALALSKRKSEFLTRDRSKLSDILARVRKDGYATTLFDSNPAVGLAVPVLKNGLAIAAVIMRCYRNAIPLDQAIERYLPGLQSLASAIVEDQED